MYFRIDVYLFLNTLSVDIFADVFPNRVFLQDFS